MQASGISSEKHFTAFWLTLLLLAAFAYAFGLDGQYVPSNGDEMVYVHIARETAATGQWLPLASELVDTRNTKPPMLFWQAMVAGSWGEHWNMAALRTPSLLYLLLVSGAIVLCLRAVTQRWREGLMAACIFLAFLSTFRYGRPYLTSAPETFWFSLPLFALLWQRARLPAASPGWLAHLLFGLGLGLGLAYKSFALIAPAAAAWWLALVASESHLSWQTVWRHTLKTGVSAVLALAVFGLWFVLDPDPQAVWREFIVGENAAKFSDARGWWQEAFSLSGSSIWSQLLAYAVNAGLLFFVIPGLAWLGLKRLPQGRKLWPLPPHQAILLAWALVWLLVFLFPSQRSARYVIPAMPAVAMLLALHWRDIARAWFLPTLLIAGLALLVIARIAWIGYDLGLSSTPELVLPLLAVAAGAVVIAVGLWRSAWSRGAAVLASLLVYVAFNLSAAPMDGPVGRYGAQAIAATPQGKIAVPNGFNSQFERFQFLLPGPHHFLPYETGARAMARRAEGVAPPTPAEELRELLATHAAVVWIQSEPAQTAPPCLPGCRVLGERWLLTSRHLPGEVRLDNLWYPQQWLYRREWLLVPS
ncbi:MAG: glycosyl transferase [Hylemonella sp.]|nr:glycosyl transferase [Hylemonella sp.]